MTCPATTPRTTVAGDDVRPVMRWWSAARARAASTGSPASGGRHLARPCPGRVDHRGGRRGGRPAPGQAGTCSMSPSPRFRAKVPTNQRSSWPAGPGRPPRDRAPPGTIPGGDQPGPATRQRSAKMPRRRPGAGPRRRADARRGRPARCPAELHRPLPAPRPAGGGPPARAAAGEGQLRSRTTPSTLQRQLGSPSRGRSGPGARARDGCAASYAWTPSRTGRSPRTSTGSRAARAIRRAPDRPPRGPTVRGSAGCAARRPCPSRSPRCRRYQPLPRRAAARSPQLWLPRRLPFMVASDTTGRAAKGSARRTTVPAGTEAGGDREAGAWRAWGPYLSERPGGPCARTTARGAPPGTTSPTTTPGRAPTAGTRTAWRGSATWQRLCLGLALWNGATRSSRSGCSGSPARRATTARTSRSTGGTWTRTRPRLDRWRYHYPQREFPYADWWRRTAGAAGAARVRAGRHGVFDDDRYLAVGRLREGRSP